MSFQLQRYIEALEPGEVDFLLRKEEQERKTYYRIFSILMFMSFILPFAGAWVQAFEGAPHAFSPLRYFSAVFVLLFISGVSTSYSYKVNHRKLQLDIRDRTKTVDTIRITRKTYVGLKKTYHFYVDSRIKLSIEVSANDFERLNAGDEVSIEYTTHSQQYLGYF